MKYYIKQDVFTFGEYFVVNNQYGEDVYKVKGSFFKIPKEFVIYNLNDQVVAHIEKQMFRFLSHFDIHTNNQTLTVKNNFSLFHTDISIVGSPWNLRGDFLSRNYSVVNGDHPIMTLQKHWFTWGDSYELDIANPNDLVLCLAIAIIVDRIIEERRNSSNG